MASSSLRAICLMGPTASGKSSLAESLAQQLPLEIVSVDSAQVYRGMDIGTAKPDAVTRAQIPHHLLDIRDPAEPYSAADFREDAVSCIADICARGRVPLLVGGTMLYFKALKAGLAELPPANPEIRQKISEEAAQHGWPWVHAALSRVDPEAAARINPNDPQRLQRALEVFQVSGRSLTDWQKAQRATACPVELLELAVVPPDRAALHLAIARRFDQMLNSGFLSEVEALYQRGDLHPGLPSIKAVGYRQAWAHLDGEIDFETMKYKAVVATRQLAKRQFTWLRSWEDLQVLETPDQRQALKIVESGSILA